MLSNLRYVIKKVKNILCLGKDHLYLDSVNGNEFLFYVLYYDHQFVMTNNIYKNYVITLPKTDRSIHVSNCS